MCARSFVFCFVCAGTKISNLVFVVVRQSVDGIVLDDVDNFARHKTNSDFHCRALDLLFQRDDIFKPGMTVYLSGDHGPHFW
jgi:hypothetical protein